MKSIRALALVLLLCAAPAGAAPNDAQATRIVRASREGLVRVGSTRAHDSNAPASGQVDLEPAALHAINLREFDRADGLDGLEGVKRHRSVVVGPRGRIWFSLNRGLSVVDPAVTTDTSAPAIVHVDAVSADGTPIDPRDETRLDARADSQALRIPAGGRRLTFGFAGLSLSVPDRVRYRYRLDGFDRDWSAPMSIREAVYTNLEPGPYRFRVIASNSDGLWNSAEASLGIDIAPMYWQTMWFRASVVLVGILIGVGFYRYRLHQVAKQLNVRFEERLAERTRIAQELHDTLLQGFLSASILLDLEVDRLPQESPAKPPLTRVLELMRQVIDEGRNAVRGLRASTRGADDLEAALTRVPGDLAIPDHIVFRVIVEGRPRPLHPMIRDEAYRIGREALVNAFRHAAADRIEVQLDYAAHHMRLLVRDNGRGIDPDVVRSGREGHWGLSGMRERAERIGARVTVWSRAAAGTEVELFVPGGVAFVHPSADRPWRGVTQAFRRVIGKRERAS